MLPSSIKIQKPSDILCPSFSLSASCSIFPCGALKWLENNSFRGNILTSFHWGEYVIWHIYPHCKVAFDGRYETVYPELVQKEYFDFVNANDRWKYFLEKYPHDAILVNTKTRIYFLLTREPAWRVAYTDRLCTLFIRDDQLLNNSFLRVPQ